MILLTKQYFVKPPIKPEVSADQIKTLTEDDLKPFKKATDYSLNDDILEKIHK